MPKGISGRPHKRPEPLVAGNEDLFLRDLATCRVQVLPVPMPGKEGAGVEIEKVDAAGVGKDRVADDQPEGAKEETYQQSGSGLDRLDCVQIHRASGFLSV
jgi:hypothetical protein